MEICSQHTSILSTEIDFYPKIEMPDNCKSQNNMCKVKTIAQNRLTDILHGRAALVISTRFNGPQQVKCHEKNLLTSAFGWRTSVFISS